MAMKKERLIVVNISELAARWQIPVERVVYLITNCGMDMRRPEKWAVQHWDLFMAEKQKAFEDSLFPRRFRLEASEASA